MFNPKDFLVLAKRIIDDTSYINIDESAFRTAISRSYYAAFLTIREHITNIINPTPHYRNYHKIIRTGIAHSFIKYILTKTDRLMGNMYGKLLKDRKAADYDTNKNIHKKQAEEAIKIAEYLITQSKKINTSNLSTIESAINIYLRKIK